MGNTASGNAPGQFVKPVGKAAKLSSSEIGELKAKTDYKTSQIKSLHSKFNEEVLEGKLHLEDFASLAGLAGIKDSFLQGLLFRSMDKNNKGYIGFSDVLAHQHTLTHGSPEERLSITFRMYDLNGDGFLTRDEMLKIMEGLYAMLGDLVYQQGEGYDRPYKLVDSWFVAMDTNLDGRISFEEFRVAVLRDPSLVQYLGLF